MSKTINTVVELTEKELECVTGGGIIVGRITMRGEGGRVGAESPKIKYRSRPIP